MVDFFGLYFIFVLYTLSRFYLFVATGLILGIVIPAVVVFALIGLYVFRSKLPALKR